MNRAKVGNLFGAFSIAISGLTLVALVPLAATKPAGATQAPRSLMTSGMNLDGQLGVGDDTGPATCTNDVVSCSTTPVAVALPAEVEPTDVVAAGGQDVYVVGTDGNLYAWGDNGAGQLGDGTSSGPQTCNGGIEPCSPTPVTVDLPEAALPPTEVVTSGFTTLAVGANGVAYAWGSNTFGQLGQDSTGVDGSAHVTGPDVCSESRSCSITPLPVDIPDAVTAAEVGVNAHAAYVLGTNGTVYAFGFGEFGELGNGADLNPGEPSQELSYDDPTAVSLGGALATAIYTGVNSAFAVTSSTTYDWGLNNNGQLGHGEPSSDDTSTGPDYAVSTAWTVDLPAGVTPTDMVSTQFYDTFAVGSDGNLYEWGANSAGDFGNGNSTGSTSPEILTLPTGIVPDTIAAADGYQYAEAGVYLVDTAGDLYEWGINVNGEFGDDAAQNNLPETVSTPVLFTGFRQVFTVAAGSSVLVAVTKPAIVTLMQGSPIGEHVAAGAGYTGDLSVTNAFGAVSYSETPSADSSDVVVDSAGHISASSSLAPGTYEAGGSSLDLNGDSGAWSFTLVVGPSSVNFGNVPVNTTVSGSVTLTIDAGYSFGGSETSPPFSNPSGGSCDSNPTFAGPGTCTALVAFSPTSTGPASGTVSFSECPNGGGLCTAIPVTTTGTGITTAASSPSSVNFGNVPVNTTVSGSVTLTIDAGYSFGGSVTNSPFSNPSGGSCDSNPTFAGPGSCTALVAFSPTSTGPASGSVTFDEYPNGGGAGIPIVVSITGTGITTAASSPSSVNFGNVPVNTTVSESVTLTIDAGYSFGGSETSPPFSNPSGGSCDSNPTFAGPGSCTALVAFSPTSTGPASGTVSFSECPNGGGLCTAIPVTTTGTGITTAASSPSSVNFGNVPVNTTVSESVTLTIDAGYSFGGSETSPPFSNPSGGSCDSNPTFAGPGSCTALVAFSPTSTGPASGTVSFSECPNGGGLCTAIPVTTTGTGITTAASSPSSVNFGNVPVNTTVSGSVTLTIDAGYSFGGSETSPPFSNPSGGSCDSNPTFAGPGSCTALVAFSPTSTGPASGTVSFSECPNGGGLCTAIPVTTTGTGTGITTVATTRPTNAPPPPSTGVPAADFGTPASGIASSSSVATVTKSSDGANSSVTVPAGALPAGTTVSVYPVTNTTALAAEVPTGQSYIVSFAVSWEAPNGTSPAATAPITMTVKDPSILAGDTIYQLTSAGLVAVGTATVNGSVTITFTNDPTFVVSAVPKLHLVKSHGTLESNGIGLKVSCRVGAACRGSAKLTIVRRKTVGKKSVVEHFTIASAKISINAKQARTVVFGLTASGKTVLAEQPPSTDFHMRLSTVITGAVQSSGVGVTIETPAAAPKPALHRHRSA